MQPIGFVCDHVEVLYDVDIAFRRFAEEKGLRLWRAESLNDSPAFIQAVAALAAERLRNIQTSSAPWTLQVICRRPRRRAATMMRIAIVGAGITGLSAALALETARAQGALPSTTSCSKALRASAARCFPNAWTDAWSKAAPIHF